MTEFAATASSFKPTRTHNDSMNSGRYILGPNAALKALLRPYSEIRCVIGRPAHALPAGLAIPRPHPACTAPQPRGSIEPPPASAERRVRLRLTAPQPLRRGDQ